MAGAHKPPAKKPAPKKPVRKPIGLRPIRVGNPINIVHEDRISVNNRAPAVTHKYTGAGWVYPKKKPAAKPAPAPAPKP